MQDIRVKGQLDRHTLFFLLTISLSSAELEKKNLVPGCSVVAVITIWKQYVVSTEHAVVVAGFSVDVCSII